MEVAHDICMIIFGFFLLIAFPVWEEFFAPVTFIPYGLLLDRTVFSAGCMFVCIYFNSSVWGSCSSSLLQVVWNPSVTEASYVTQVLCVQSGWSFFFLGHLIRYTGRFEWTLTYFMVPLDILAIGLIIHFHQPGTSIGLHCDDPVFTAVAGRNIVIGGELAMMAPSDHQHIALILAVLNLFCFIGSAAGPTVNAAIWTATFRENLVKHVGIPSSVNVNDIYAALPKQLSYKWGSPERLGIDLAYGPWWLAKAHAHESSPSSACCRWLSSAPSSSATSMSSTTSKSSVASPRLLCQLQRGDMSRNAMVCRQSGYKKERAISKVIVKVIDAIHTVIISGPASHCPLRMLQLDLLSAFATANLQVLP
ncbi:uncharacterized protein M421DRAFT_419733 [Didymella exigua CBS 183.55]|uniref:MFS general substrate transporter n=1 Tax=Didymella exigua CBS 183.55 TaxID=1150837 RepID=A0A6A5RN64_9PLEO|nr:uncharacterized protein M421DRAFT_419733 [Didymella exigua CBS 183.55]KAF1929212.1 hypothetical protein M421DRAFT_419733 [Didymella exigua CBS 183.55]